MPRDAVAVEFVLINYVFVNPDTVTPRYIALVVEKSGRASLFNLGDAAIIDRTVDLYRRHMAVIAERRKPVGTKEGMEYRKIAATLYDLVWRPFESVLNGRRMICVAPDGGLNLVSFAALMGSDRKYIIEKNLLHSLSAVRDIIPKEGAGSSGSGLLALGDPDFDAPASERIASRPSAVRNSGSEDPYQLRNMRSGCEQLKSMTVSRLYNTRIEVGGIVDTWREYNPSEPVVHLVGSMASEEVFKATSAGKRVLHLATHGYFLDASRPPAGSEGSGNGENPLLLSGLLLAGANLHGRGAREYGTEDGILTALEVSALPLEGVELVVLSACESGLGNVKQGEGVYGLRRAFQIAGAKSVVSTLWQVPDLETMKFMKDLYATMLPSHRTGGEKIPYPALMQKVALERIREQRLRGRPDHPFTWGAYVATGDWQAR